MHKHVDAIHERPHLKLIEASIQVCAHSPALMWGDTGIGVLHKFAAPLLNKNRRQDAYHVQKETEKHEDIQANGNIWRGEWLGVGRG